MNTENRAGRFSRFCYRILWALVKFFYPRIRVEGAENLPDEACIVVGNHCQMHGPVSCELYFPGDRAIWCAEQMMTLEEVPPYAYQDFWSGKPKGTRWFFKIASYVIAPLAVCIFNNAHTIPVYRDTRTITTFRRTVEAMQRGANIIIFPECYEEHNNIVYNFQRNFVDVAKLYYRRTGKAPCFVPMYLAPELKTLYLGTPTRYNPENPVEEERERICGYLMDEITKIATGLPRHRVVPYRNLPRKQYQFNIPCEEADTH